MLQCDGTTPSCSRCVNRSLLCHYAIDSDQRRSGSKAHVDSLRKRIGLLERALEFREIDVEEAIALILSEDATTQKSSILGATSNKQTDETHFARRMMSASPDTVGTAMEGTLTMEESLNFDQDGEIRYFGPSSGRLQFQADKNKTDTTRPHSSASNFIGNQQTGWVRFRQNQLIQSVMEESKVSEELRNHLIDMYFTWEQPWCWVVNERLFRESEHSGGRYCSPLLLNCILAVASRFTNRVDVRSDPSDPNTAGKLFLDNAEVLLHYDLKWPTITTIQALSIMGTIYVVSS